MSAIEHRPSPSLDEVLSILREHRPELRRHHGIAWLGVFGSYARGEQQPDSDIDLLVEFDPVPGLWAYSNAERELERLLQAKVDLVMRRALKAELAPAVLDEVVEV
jgi:predicted nucleotidyltransferase